MSIRKKILFGFVTLTMLAGVLESAARVLRHTRERESAVPPFSERDTAG